jgi:hypothetical protein
MKEQMKRWHDELNIMASSQECCFECKYKWNIFSNEPNCYEKCLMKKAPLVDEIEGRLACFKKNYPE